MDIISNILSVLTGFVSFGFAIYILSKFLYRKNSWRPVLIGVIIIAATMALFLINILRIPWVNSLSVIAIYIVIIHILFKGNFALKFGFSIIITTINVLSEEVVLFITMLISRLGWEELTGDPLYSSVSGILTLLIFIVIGRSLARVFLRKYSALKLSDMFLIAFQIMAMVAETFMLKSLDTIQMSFSDVIFYSLLQIAILTSSVLIFFIFERAMRRQELEKQIEIYRYQFEQIKTSQAAIGKMQHDFEKHLLALKLDLDNYMPSEAGKKIDKLIGSLHMAENVADSGDADVDAILNYKAKQAAEFGIRVACELRLPYTLHMNTTDLSVILGNAIDNAIEACKLVEPPERIISIAISYEKPNLRLTFINPFDGELKQNADGEFATTKQGDLHGIGLKSIKDTVEKYDGIMDMAAENGRFVLKIMLFNLICQ